MASILSLPDECLRMIVSCINDPSSFYNIALTCKRFQQVTKNTKSVLNTNLLKAKAEYYTKCYIVATSGDKWYLTDTTRIKHKKLTEFLNDSVRFAASKELLTYDKVIDVWQRNGPVVAKLFTWLRNKETSVKNINGPYCYKTSSTKNWTVALHLPGCGKTMVIKTSYFIELTDLPPFDTARKKQKQLCIRITFGEIDVTTKFILGKRVKLENFKSWQKETLSRAVEPIKVAMEVLQREIGETDPPISNGFFIWLCCFFSDKSNLLEENRVTFRDAARNTRPTLASVQTAVLEYHEFQQFEANLQKLLSGWEEDEDQNSKYSKIIAETVCILAQRSEAKILNGLQKDACRFHKIATGYDIRLWPKQFLLDLVLRTSLDKNTYTPALSIKDFRENRLFFKCLRGSVMKVRGSFQFEGLAFKKLEMEFTLPDGKVLKLEAPFEIETLSPVTELLMEGENHAMQGEEHITKRNHFRTALYFLHALEFSETFDFAFSSFDREFLV